MSQTLSVPLAYQRFRSHVVHVGSVPLGGSHPLRVQSMLTSSTQDLPAVLGELHRLMEAGCEIARLTVPTAKDVRALAELRRRMHTEAITLPLVADIHFNPRLALDCVPLVEKVRINPGNYVDQKRFQAHTYSDAEYALELARVRDTLLPLIAALKQHRRALRIGVNHGSLSDRIMNRYGDNPGGMVECAMEYLRILVEEGFQDVVVSMKSSNALVAAQAYRLLVLRMQAEGMSFPLHVGVTEAGSGLEGRLKSAVGIGGLLVDGLGDTVRVSLTEPAEAELAPARELVAAATRCTEGPTWPALRFPAAVGFTRRQSNPLLIDAEGTVLEGTAFKGTVLGGEARTAFLGLVQGDLLLPTFGEEECFDAHIALPATHAAPLARNTPPTQGTRLLPLRLIDAELPCAASGEPLCVWVSTEEVDSAPLEALFRRCCAEGRNALLMLHGRHVLAPLRWLALRLESLGLRWPLGVALEAESASPEPELGLAAELGALAVDGLLDALACPADRPQHPLVNWCRCWLQAARLRAYKTEFISCPSCGRTLFDLQSTTARIQARTGHLKGMRIGVMGCIVNGPGEMADADFGYVGGAPGKVNLYKGQRCVERGVPTEQAVDRLVALIKAHDAWEEPPAA